jgi:hypothetical protein
LVRSIFLLRLIGLSYGCRGGHGYGSIRRAQKFNARQSNKAKHIGEGLRAPLAKSTEHGPTTNRLDLPNVDSPEK